MIPGLLALALAPVVLSGATLLDGTGAPPLKDAVVVLQGDRIAGAGPRGAVAVPEGARAIDLSGRWLIPGLIDAHAHVAVLPPGQNGRLQDHDDRAVSQRVLALLLASGITTVRNPAAPAADGVALREEVATGRAIGPRILTAGESLNRPLPGLDGPAVGVATEKEVRREIDRQAAIGVDFVKVYATLAPDLVKVAIEAAHAHGLKVIGHLQRTSWTEGARLGIDFLTHAVSWSSGELPPDRREAYDRILGSRERLAWLEAVDPAGPEIATMIQEIVKRRIAVDPTLVANEAKLRPPAAFDETSLPPLLVRIWEAPGFTYGWSVEEIARGRSLFPKLLGLVKRYHDRGVTLLAGSDTPNPGVLPGAGLHRELQLLAEVGIPPLEILTIATRNNALALGVGKETGTIEAGKRADLVVLTADPLADIASTRKIESIWLGGVRYDPAELVSGKRRTP